MQAIDLTHGYRVVRMDDRNWKMQHFHKPTPGPRATDPDTARWYDEGGYYQNLARALEVVYERVLREPDGTEHGLAEALEEARALESELMGVTGRLSDLPSENVVDDGTRDVGPEG